MNNCGTHLSPKPRCPSKTLKNVGLSIRSLGAAALRLRKVEIALLHSRTREETLWRDRRGESADFDFFQK